MNKALLEVILLINCLEIAQETSPFWFLRNKNTRTGNLLKEILFQIVDNNEREISKKKLEWMRHCKKKLDFERINNDIKIEISCRN